MTFQHDPPASIEKINAEVAVIKLLKNLWRDERGAIAMYFALLTPVFVLIGAVVIDLSRQDSFNTQIQNFVDAAALAGAKELDKQLGARDRALEAARNVLANTQDFAYDGPQILLDGGLCPVAGATPDANDSAGCVYFLKRLPTLDTDPINHSVATDPNSDLSTGDSDTLYIEVRVNRRSMRSLMLNALASPSESLDTGAVAVAGQNQVICNIPGFFMCNPVEASGNGNVEEFDIDALNALAGTQFRAFIQSNAGGGGNSYTNGNWGLICPLGDGNCGANSAKEVLASASGTCVDADEATTKPGVDLGQVRAGINVRMDRYATQAQFGGSHPIWPNKDWRDLWEFRPAINVTQAAAKKPGGGGAKCEYDPLPAGTAMGLPRDPCFATSSCPGYGGTNPSNHMGEDPLPSGNESPYNGIQNRPMGAAWNWDYIEYFRINHGCDPSDSNFDTSCPSQIGWPDSDRWPPTYFETYRFEIETTEGAGDPRIVDVGQLIPGGGLTTEEGIVDNNDPVADCYTPEAVGDPPVSPPPLSADNYGFWTTQGGDITEALMKDRRAIVIAVVNCNALENTGTNTSGRFTFNSFKLGLHFLTEPMEEPSGSTIYTEWLGLVDVEIEEQFVKRLIQLYRRNPEFL